MIELPADLTRSTKVLLVMDVVESVRIMEQDQDGFVRRWQQLVEEAEHKVLPQHGGRIVKSLGDGLMLEFASAQGCVKAAFALHNFTRQANASVRPEHQLHLRMGGHLASFVTDQHDIYGTDVNLTSRVSTLSGPGELVVSAALRDHLTAGLDADIEDLGECHLKHVEKPVRAYRIGVMGHAPVIPSSHAEQADFRPTVAVIPFEARSNEPEHFVIGELIADGIIAQLSRSPDIRVISRLSTTAFRGRAGVMPDVGSRLEASFVLSGSYIASGGKILLMAELADTRKNEIIWAERISGDTGDLLQSHSELLNRLAEATSRALIDTEVKQSLVQPMPRLDSSSLLLGGIAMMHRSSIRDFERSREALDALIERHNRIATPRAWLAKWHIMRIIRGLSDSPQRDTQFALEQTKRALDSEPENALTLAVEGYAHCQLLGNVEETNNRLTRAIRTNPNEPMAWLFKSVASSMWGSAPDSVNEAEYARALSPIDPLGYYFDLLAAAALLADNMHERAIEYAKKSLKLNRHHSPTLRVLLTAQTEIGLFAEATDTLRALYQEEPHLTVSAYLSMGSASSVTRQRCANALRTLGLPEK
ncbi:MAG: adenylate/guanylate cyclase domain-containing protein [Pseudomonadota bacterium]